MDSSLLEFPTDYVPEVAEFYDELGLLVRIEQMQIVHLIKRPDDIFIRSFPIALLIAAEDRELNGEMNAEQLLKAVERQLLQAEVLSLVRLTYLLDAYQLDKLLRSRWTDKRIISN